MVRVLVWAPNPLSGPSPGRLAGSVCALDSSVEAEPSLGTLGEACRMQGRTTGVLEVSAPALLDKELCLQAGGVCRLGELYVLRRELTNM